MSLDILISWTLSTGAPEELNIPMVRKRDVVVAYRTIIVLWPE